MQETWVQFLGQEDPLEKEIATHSSIFAWRIPWTEEPGGYLATEKQYYCYKILTITTIYNKKKNFKSLCNKL